MTASPTSATRGKDDARPAADPAAQRAPRPAAADPISTDDAAQNSREPVRPLSPRPWLFVFLLVITIGWLLTVLGMYIWTVRPLHREKAPSNSAPPEIRSAVT